MQSVPDDCRRNGPVACRAPSRRLFLLTSGLIRRFRQELRVLVAEVRRPRVVGCLVLQRVLDELESVVGVGDQLTLLFHHDPVRALLNDTEREMRLPPLLVDGGGRLVTDQPESHFTFGWANDSSLMMAPA